MLAWCSMVCRRKDLFVDKSLRAHFCANRTAQDGFSDTVNGEMAWDCEGRYPDPSVSSHLTDVVVTTTVKRFKDAAKTNMFFRDRFSNRNHSRNSQASN